MCGGTLLLAGILWQVSFTGADPTAGAAVEQAQRDYEGFVANLTVE
jgi:hypothetical protein